MLLGRCVLLFLFLRWRFCASNESGQSSLPVNSVETGVSGNHSSLEKISANSTNSTHGNPSQKFGVSYVAKCCPRGSIVSESVCERYTVQSEVSKIESKILRQMKQFTANPTSATIQLYHQDDIELQCGFTESKALSHLYVNPDRFIEYTTANLSSFDQPEFQILGENETALFLRYYYESYWNLDYRVSKYCVDMKKIRSQEGVIYDGHVFYCIKPSSVSKHYPIMLYISSIALVFTFVMYSITPAKGAAKILSPGANSPHTGFKGRRSTLACLLTGRNLLSHISSLCLAFVCLAITQQGFIKPGQSGCIAIGYIIYTTSLASFTWLTVYCFDYFWMFRGSFKVAKSILFTPYSFFGWGIPAIALVIAVVAQFYPKSGLPASVNPNMGLLSCWFASDTSLLVFFYLPISALLSLNIIFFMALILNPNLMHCRKRVTSGPQLRSNQIKTSENEKHRDDIKMAIKLFFITGIPWVFEIAAWVPMYLYKFSSDNRAPILYLFEISNLLNALRGVAIFVLFVLLHRDVRAQLLLRLSKLATNVPSQQNTDGPNSTSNPAKRSESSQHLNSSSSAKKSSSRQSLVHDQSLPTDLQRQLSFDPDEITVL